jgi:hypothetical protein
MSILSNFLLNNFALCNRVRKIDETHPYTHRFETAPRFATHIRKFRLEIDTNFTTFMDVLSDII